MDSGAGEGFEDNDFERELNSFDGYSLGLPGFSGSSVVEDILDCVNFERLENREVRY